MARSMTDESRRERLVDQRSHAVIHSFVDAAVDLLA